MDEKCEITKKKVGEWFGFWVELNEVGKIYAYFLRVSCFMCVDHCRVFY